MRENSFAKQWIGLYPHAYQPAPYHFIQSMPLICIPPLLLQPQPSLPLDMNKGEIVEITCLSKDGWTQQWWAQPAIHLGTQRGPNKFVKLSSNTVLGYLCSQQMSQQPSVNTQVSNTLLFTFFLRQIVKRHPS